MPTSKRFSIFGSFGLAVLAMLGTAWAAELHHRGGCPRCHCPDSCCYEEVVTHVCVTKEVKTPIKKTVYECKEVPYCLHKVSRHGECGCCEQCESCPRYKKVLIKKEITCGEKCETKCVVEEVKQLVPVSCHRCGFGCQNQSANGPCATGGQGPAAIPVAPADTTPQPPMPVPAKPIVDPSAAMPRSRTTVPQVFVALPGK